MHWFTQCFVDGLYKYFASKFYWWKQSYGICSTASQIIQANSIIAQTQGAFTSIKLKKDIQHILN